jgi:hypothetical protein
MKLKQFSLVERAMNIESCHSHFRGFVSQLAVSLAVILAVCAGTAWAEDVSVDCSDPNDSIKVKLGALDKTVTNTVTIFGVCTEPVLVEGFTDLTLNGSQGSGLRRDDTFSSSALQIRSSDRVTLSNLTFLDENRVPVQDIYHGALVDISRSSVGIWACAIRGSVSTGLGIGDKSYVDLVGSTIEDNPGGGINVGGGSRLNISYYTDWWENEDRTSIQRNGSAAAQVPGISAGTGAEVNVGEVIIRDNPYGGVSASNGAFVNLGTWGTDVPFITGNGALPAPAAVAAGSGSEIWIISATKIDGNRGNGAEAGMGGRLVVCCAPDASISNNAGFGVRAWGGGGVFFWGGAQVRGNHRGGVSLFWGKAFLNPDVVIRENGDGSDPNSYGGVLLEADSSAEGVFTVSNNNGPGVWIKGGSHALFHRNTSITGNKGGVQLEVNSMAEFNNDVDVTGNTANKRFDLFCTAGTTAGAPKGVHPNIGKMSCPGWTQFLPLPAWQASER